MARALGRGLHADGQAIPPRDFRRTHGPCRGPAGPADTATTSATSAATPRPPVAPAAAAAPAVREATARRCDGRRYCSQMTSCDEA
ncbi:MAG: hypothetical protein MUE62_04845, partial [Burkholderiaceae bacterium]|nr:hypothetical protein [Burkholderiaceae bacterium]